MSFSTLDLLHTGATVAVLGVLATFTARELVYVTADTDALIERHEELRQRDLVLEGLLHRVALDSSLPVDAPERSTWVVTDGQPLPPLPVLDDAATPSSVEGQFFARAAVRASRKAAPELNAVKPVWVDEHEFVVLGGPGVQIVARADAFGWEFGPDPLAAVPMTVGSPTDGLWQRLGPALAATLFLCFLLVMDLFRFWRARNAERHASAALAEVLQRMSHDLRTPAASVQALVEALTSDAVTEPEEREEFLALINSEARRLSDGIKLLLRAARGEEPVPFSPVRMDLAEWAGGVARRWRTRLPSLRLVAPELCPAHADPERLDEAIDVLLDNALRYGGSQVELEVAIHSDCLTLAVTDDGPGVRWWERRRVLRKGARGWGHERGGGGLGLWVASEVAKAHGGSFKLEGGHRFVVRLPR